MENEIEKKLSEIFRKVFRDEKISINRDTTAENIISWDSLTHIDLIITVEEELDVKIPTLRAAQLKNVGELIDMIIKLKNEK